MSERRPPFERALRRLVKRPDLTALAITDHLAASTGSFDRLTQSTDPMQVETIDLLGVTVLGSPLPGAGIEWLVSDEGRWLSAEILADIRVDARIDDTDTRCIIRAGDLFRLLRTRPPVKLSRSAVTRILAAKRPALVPIDDRSSRDFFGYPKGDEWWMDWRLTLTSEVTERIEEARSEAAREIDAAAGLSDLRVLDIAMRAKTA